MAEGDQPQRPASRNELANEIVGLLRMAARKIIELGDMVESERVVVLGLRKQVASFEEAWHRAEDVSVEHDEWRDLLEDFRSGIRDAQEVLAGTVGR